MVHKLYPYGKKKAFNVTYDDGVLQDVRFVELLNQYGLKGTFNLNSALIENEFEWIHEKGCVVKRLKTDAVKSLYAGHEVASHTLNHPYMHDLSKEGVIWELAQDKRTLEALFGEEIKGLRGLIQRENFGNQLFHREPSGTEEVDGLFKICL